MFHNNPQKIFRLNVSIVYCIFKHLDVYKRQGEYVRLHLADRTTITTLFRLKNMEAALPAASFMRVHRSYIVNLQRIKGFVKGRIFLSDDEYVPIGENYRDAFQEYIDTHYRNL